MKRKIQHCVSYSEKARFERLLDRMDKAEREAKIRADCSGNATVYSSALCDQTYLMSLIPRIH